MASPATSGTGFLAIAGFFQIMGEEAGWKYLDALNENVAFYTPGGNPPCVQASQGEYLMGISYDMIAAVQKTKGAPIDIILPKEGVGWEMDSTAIMRGTKNLDAAKKFADWSVTRQANAAYAKYYAIVAFPGIDEIPPNYPPGAEQARAKIDFKWTGANRERIVAEWTKRYGSKAKK